MTALILGLPGVWAVALVGLVAFLRHAARQHDLLDAAAEVIRRDRAPVYLPRHRADGPPIVGTGDYW